MGCMAGEVALPGGKREEGDADDVQKALREAKEEIGLDPSLVSYGVTIIPVVGVLSDKDAFSPILNSAEVEAIFDVPLVMFLKNDYRRAEEREWMGEKHLVHYFDYEDGNNKYVIWAITASILIRAATLLLQRSPTFLEQRPKIWGGMTENDMIILGGVPNNDCLLSLYNNLTLEAAFLAMKHIFASALDSMVEGIKINNLTFSVFGNLSITFMC